MPPALSDTPLPAAIDRIFLRDVIAGLSRKQKTLPCKYFYDARGSALFEEICRLEEYYPTRTEIGILRAYLPEMAAIIGSDARIVEFGAGAGTKTELLLAALQRPEAYIPIEISDSALADCVHRLKETFPALNVEPLHADYMDNSLFERLKADKPLTVFFPGSTLGNFDKSEAVAFLTRIKRLTGKAGGLLIGIDVMKEDTILIPAYDDGKGVTAAFNKNLLVRINNELGGNFNMEGFTHRAIVNRQQQRVEMHLVSTRAQLVSIDGTTFNFSKGETIHTENSHKYTMATFLMLAKAAGLTVRNTWMDERNYFSMHFLQEA